MSVKCACHCLTLVPPGQQCWSKAPSHRRCRHHDIVMIDVIFEVVVYRGVYDGHSEGACSLHVLNYFAQWHGPAHCNRSLSEEVRRVQGRMMELRK